MGIEYSDDKLDELLRLTRENNKMLHAQRRNAWISGFFRLLMWAAFVIIPFWLYMQYLAPVMQSMLESYQEIQGTSAKAQAQFGELNSYLQKFQQMTGSGTKAQQ